MAAGLGYKEFTTGDVLTAADANGYLASQVVMVFASAAARTSAITSPQEGMISYLKDTNSTEYYSGSAWVAIGGGGGGGGKVLQVVSATTTTSTAITSTTQTDTTITATITPTLSTSKILVLISANAYVVRTGADFFAGARVMRGATAIADYQDYGLMGFSDPNTNTKSLLANNSISYLDSPATTSATTYKLQARVASSGTVTFQISSFPSTITLLEIGA
jgi:hypothetical protein